MPVHEPATRRTTAEGRVKEQPPPIALNLAFRKLQANNVLAASPVTGQVAAVSCGLVGGEAVLDLDYAEDSSAEADANFVLTAGGGIVEIQGTAERDPFSEDQFGALMRLARTGTERLFALQRDALGDALGA